MYANSTMGFIKVIYCPSVSPSFSYPRNSVSYTSLPVLKETSLGYFQYISKLYGPSVVNKIVLQAVKRFFFVLSIELSQKRCYAFATCTQFGWCCMLQPFSPFRITQSLSENCRKNITCKYCSHIRNLTQLEMMHYAT